MLFDLISDTEKDIIKNYILSYAGVTKNFYSQENSMAPLNYILRFWEEAKSQYLFKMFENKLILKKDIEYKESDHSLTQNLNETLFFNPSQKIKNFLQNFKEVCKNIDGIKIINTKTKKEEHCFAEHNDFLFYELFCIDSLSKNTYCRNDLCIKVPLQTKKSFLNITNGTKISKIIGKISQDYNISGYEDFRQAHSLCLNQKKLEGKLVLSIHPLDYLTMSHNDCDWSSCMSWVEGESYNVGSFRRGTVEMMNSPMVIVAYIESETPMIIDFSPNEDQYEWNNKKWRELFIVDKNVITGVKGYPYQNNDLEESVLKWIKELVDKNLKEFNFYHNLIEYHSEMKEIAEIGHPFWIIMTTNDMYNDFSGNKIKGYVSLDIPKENFINYSGASQCMFCGEESPFSDGSFELVCDDCEHLNCCDLCGEISLDLISIDGYEVCECCSQTETFYCPIDQEYHLTGIDTAIFVHFGESEEKILYDVGFEVYGPTLYNNDFNDNLIRQNIKAIPDKNGYDSDTYYLILNDEMRNLLRQEGIYFPSQKECLNYSDDSYFSLQTFFDKQ